MTTEIESLYSGFGVDNRKNILLVDDDPTYLHMLGGALLDAYNVSMAKSGEQALSYLESNTMPDLILLDYEMPGMSGTEVLDKIRNNRRTEDIPVVFLTGKNDSDTVMQVLSKRPDGYPVPYQRQAWHLGRMMTKSRCTKGMSLGSEHKKPKTCLNGVVLQATPYV